MNDEKQKIPRYDQDEDGSWECPDGDWMLAGDVLPVLDAANKRIAELDAAIASVETEVNALPCQTCGIGSECSAHDRITRIAGTIKKANGGANT